jgi:hypothetical protein
VAQAVLVPALPAHFGRKTPNIKSQSLAPQQPKSNALKRKRDWLTFHAKR